MLKSLVIIFLTMVLLQALSLEDLFKALMVAVLLGGLWLVCWRWREEGQRKRPFIVTTLFDVVGSITVTLGLSPFVFDQLQERGWKINTATVVFFGFFAMLFGWQIRTIVVALVPFLMTVVKLFTFMNFGGLQTDILKTLEKIKEEEKKFDSLAPDPPEDEIKDG